MFHFLFKMLYAYVGITRSENHANNIKFDRKLNALLRVNSLEYKLFENKNARVSRRELYLHAITTESINAETSIAFLSCTYNKSIDAQLNENTCYIHSFSNAKIIPGKR